MPAVAHLPEQLEVLVDGAVAVCFDAPVVELFETRSEALHPSLSRLGPDLLAPDFDAAEAHRIGLVQQVVEPDDLLAAARRYIVDLAENVSPASLADTKRLDVLVTDAPAGEYAALGIEVVRS